MGRARRTPRHQTRGRGRQSAARSDDRQARSAWCPVSCAACSALPLLVVGLSLCFASLARVSLPVVVWATTAGRRRGSGRRSAHQPENSGHTATPHSQRQCRWKRDCIRQGRLRKVRHARRGRGTPRQRQQHRGLQLRISLLLPSCACDFASRLQMARVWPTVCLQARLCPSTMRS